MSQALQRANSDMPVGLLTGTKEDAIVRVEGKVKDAKAFADVVVASRNGMVVRLADLGTLVEREREPDSISRVDGVPAISFQVFKQQDANIVETGKAIKDAAEELRKGLPPGVELRLVYADSDWVENSLDGVKHTLIEGALLTIAIVFLFLHSWRSTVITGLTLPIAVISSFIAVYLFGFTLNFMTMMALSLCIGLLIDDAIVVRENIVRHVHMGKGHREAASVGTEEIGLAVMATTFAICAVFVPVAFMKGIVGKFFFPFGITVAVAVLVSLFVSFTLDPMLSSIWRDPPTNRLLKVPVLGHLMRGTDRMLDVLHGIYERAIHWIFSGRHYRMLVPPIPAWGRPFGADGQRDKSAPRSLPLRHGDAAGPGAARRHRQLRRRDPAGAAGRHRVHPGERQQLHPDERRAAGGHEPVARQRQAAPGRGDRRHLPRGPDGLDHRRRHRQRPAQLGPAQRSS